MGLTFFKKVILSQHAFLLAYSHRSKIKSSIYFCVVKTINQ